MSWDSQTQVPVGAGGPMARIPVTGEVIAGKYRLGRQLGKGATSVVFAAQHAVLGHPVAIKFLNLEQIESEAALAHFLNEGRLAAKIHSQHAARILDVNMVPPAPPYIVMEYLDGQDLAHMLHQRGTFPVSRSVDYIMQALEAIAEAHIMNIAHRDIKPSNLFIVRRPDGRKDVKVIDFGISKNLLSSEEHAATWQGALLGSPGYMSPEQVESPRDVDTRTDLWSVGVVLYELLSGKPPFQGKTLIELFRKITEEDPRSLVACCPHVPTELETVIRRCLERNRVRRYQNAVELGSALLPFGSHRARISYDSIVGVSLQSCEDDDSLRRLPIERSTHEKKLPRARGKALATREWASLADRATSSMRTSWSESRKGSRLEEDRIVEVLTTRQIPHDDDSRTIVDATMISVGSPKASAAERPRPRESSFRSIGMRPGIQAAKQRPPIEFVPLVPAESARDARINRIHAGRRCDDQPNLHARRRQDSRPQPPRRRHTIDWRRTAVPLLGGLAVLSIAMALLLGPPSCTSHKRASTSAAAAPAVAPKPGQ